MAKHYFWVCLWGCFQKISAFEFVNWVERSPSPMSAGIIQSVECQNKGDKKVGKGEFAFLAWAGTPIFFHPWTPELLVLEFSDLDQNYSISFLGSQPPGLRPNYAITFPWPLPCTWQVMGLLDFHNLVEQFLWQISSDVYLHISYWLCFFGEP